MLAPFQTGFRLLIGLALFALGCLAVFPPPNYTLWMLSVPATECGHWLGLLALTLIPGWRASQARRIAGLLAVASAAMLFSPLLRAIPVAMALPPVPAPLVDGTGPRTITLETLAYVERPDGPLLLDLVRLTPPGEPAPGVIVIHGGWWKAGDRTQLTPLDRELAARGYVVANIDYRLAPTHKFPAQRDDVEAAIAYLKRRAPEIGLDASRLVLLGRSAGGHLALSAGYGSADPAIRGVISFYGPADLLWGYDHPTPARLYDSRKVLREFLGGSPEEAPENYNAASPIRFVGAHTPPTLLIHGLRDELVSRLQPERLVDRLKAANRPVTYLQLPWATHGCDWAFYGPCGWITTRHVESFIADVTR